MRRAVFSAAVASSCLAAVSASAQTSESAPATGFTIEGRLSESLAPVGLGLTAGTLLPTLLGGPPPASLGYRGAGAELGESYLNVPLGSVSEDDGSTKEARMNVLSTFGDIHVALTL